MSDLNQKLREYKGPPMEPDWKFTLLLSIVGAGAIFAAFLAVVIVVGAFK